MVLAARQIEMLMNASMRRGNGPTFARQFTGVRSMQVHGTSVSSDFLKALTLNKFRDQRKVPSFKFLG